MKKVLIIIGIILLIFIGFLVSYIVQQNKELNGTKWILSTWSVSSITPNKPYMTLYFDNKKISGSGGINTFSGDYKIGFDYKISFKSISSTEMASTDPTINQAETMYFSLLNNIKYYSYQENELVLKDKNKNELLRYEKVNN